MGESLKGKHCQSEIEQMAELLAALVMVHGPRRARAIVEQMESEQHVAGEHCQECDAKEECDLYAEWLEKQNPTYKKLAAIDHAQERMNIWAKDCDCALIPIRLNLQLADAVVEWLEAVAFKYDMTLEQVLVDVLIDEIMNSAKKVAGRLK